MTISNIISIILGSSLLTSIVTFILHKRTEKITAQIKNDFDFLRQKFLTDLQWKKGACEIMGEIYFHLFRTRLAFDRYDKIKEKNEFLEKEVIKYSNQKIKDLIIEKGYLIHPDLTDDANELVEHYDVWLEKYDSMRVKKSSDDIHVYVGPDGYTFPKKAEDRFKKYYRKLWNELYLLESKVVAEKEKMPNQNKN